MGLSIDEYLKHIFDETTFLSGQLASLDEKRFFNDEAAKRAFVRSLEVIGEAVKQIPEDIRSRHPKIQWKLIAGMRDKLIHKYFGVDYDIVWDAVTNRVPELEKTVRKMLKVSNG